MKDIPGYEGLYAITQDGLVWGYKRHHSPAGWRKTSVSVSGYRRMSLRKNGKCFFTSVHRLVALTYIPNPDVLPQVNHIDGDKLNNNILNLEWCTGSQNIRHADRTGLRVMPSGSDNWRHKFTHCKRGHQYTNRLNSAGHRTCWICHNIQTRNSKRRSRISNKLNIIGV